MIQSEIILGGISIPYIMNDGEKYYPVSYISSRFLLRNSSLLTKGDKVKYEDKLRQLTVDYGENTGGLQETFCIPEDILIELVKRIKLGKMTAEQRVNLNYLREYLGLDKVSEDKRIINTYDYSHYNEFIRDAIDEVLSEGTEWQQCSKCENYYPLHINFYKVNSSINGKLYTYCNECNANNGFTIKESSLKIAYYKHGIDGYIMKRDHDTGKIFDDYLKSERVNFPNIIRSKEDYLKIVKHLIDVGEINKYHIIQKELLHKYKLKAINNICSMDEIYTYIHGEDYYLYPWKYKTKIFRFKELTYKSANDAFNNYINEFDIDLSNPLKMDYEELTKKEKIQKLTSGNSLYFAVQFNDFKYPGYLFKQSSVNYYKEESNLLFDMKYLIEKDMKLDINKIPLYLTRFNLQKKCPQLYRYIISKKNGSIYYWVNKLYPDKFIEADFDVNPYRNEFDSDQEMFIHEILIEKFGNVIYNQRNRENTITIDGMIPDWFVFTNRGVWIIEYFGLYDERYYKNSRIVNYMNKTHKKLDKYKKLEGYNYIFLFPSDIDNDFLGCRRKLDEIDKTVDIKAI